MLDCVFKIFSETTGPTEAKFHVESQWDRGRKFIQIMQSFVFILSSSGGGGFLQGFYHKCGPAVQGFGN